MRLKESLALGATLLTKHANNVHSTSLGTIFSYCLIDESSISKWLFLCNLKVLKSCSDLNAFSFNYKTFIVSFWFLRFKFRFFSLMRIYCIILIFEVLMKFTLSCTFSILYCNMFYATFWFLFHLAFLLLAKLSPTLSNLCFHNNKSHGKSPIILKLLMHHNFLKYEHAAI